MLLIAMLVPMKNDGFSTIAIRIINNDCVSLSFDYACDTVEIPCVPCPFILSERDALVPTVKVERYLKSK